MSRRDRPLAHIIGGQYVAPEEGSITIRPLDARELADARRRSGALLAIEGGAARARAAVQRPAWRDPEDEGPDCRRPLDVGEVGDVLQPDGTRRRIAVEPRHVPKAALQFASGCARAERAQAPWWVVELDAEGRARRAAGPFELPRNLDGARISAMRRKLLDAAQRHDPEGWYVIVASHTRPGAAQ